MCVIGEGSNLLKSIENPEHTDFEFDRIDDVNARSQAESKYRLFSKAVRDILSKFASYSTENHVVVDDLQDIFGGISGNAGSSRDGEDRGHQIQVANGGSPYRHSDLAANKRSPGGHQLLPGSTHKTGDPAGANVNKDNPGGPVDTPNGNPIIVGPSQPDEPGANSLRVTKLRNLRMRPSKHNDGEVTIFFDSDVSGRASIRLMKAGELSNEAIRILINDRSEIGVDVILEKGKRTEMTLKLAEPIIDFAIEGQVHELES